MVFPSSSGSRYGLMMVPCLPFAIRSSLRPSHTFHEWGMTCHSQRENTWFLWFLCWQRRGGWNWSRCWNRSRRRGSRRSRPLDLPGLLHRGSPSPRCSWLFFRSRRLKNLLLLLGDYFLSLPRRRAVSCSLQVGGGSRSAKSLL